MALIAIICMLSLFVFAACDNGGAGTSEPDGSISASDPKGSDGEDKTELTAPVITLNDDYSATWAAVEGATGYKVNVNGEELNVTTVITFPAFKVAGSYEIKVKALDDNAESAYSNVVKYSAYSVQLTSGEGYSLTGENLVYGGKDYSFSFAIVGDAYKSSKPVIKVNGEAVAVGEDGKYTVKNVDKNLIVTVEGVKKTEFAVTIPVGEGYEVKGADKVAYGENYSFEVKKKDGYDKSSLTVKVNGTVAEAGEDGKYTVENVTLALTITVEGATKNVYNVTLPKSVAFTVTGNATAVYGENYSFVLEIKDGYDKTNLVVKANEMRIAAGEDGKTYTLTNVTEDQTITVDGLDIIKYDVTLTAGTGYVLTGEAKVEHGGNYSFELAINEGYTNSVPVVKANGEVVKAGEDNKTYTVANVTAALTITVEGVVRNTYTVSVAEGAGFTADAAEKTVNHGEIVSFTVTAENADDVIKVYNGETEIVSAEGVYAVENVTSDVTLTVKVYDLASQMNLSWNLPVTENADGTVTVACRTIVMNEAWVKKVLDAGYTHVKFDISLTGGVQFAFTHNGTWSKFWGTYQTKDTLRVDLTEFKDGETYHGWSMEVRDSESKQTDGVFTIAKPVLIKSEETLAWTKVAAAYSSSIYLAIEEDGYMVLDTRGAGSDAYVLSPAEWWASYGNESVSANKGQRCVMFYGYYLNVGGNTRGLYFGRHGGIEHVFGEEANTKKQLFKLGSTSYTDGDRFYAGLNAEGVYKFKPVEWVANVNEFTFTQEDDNSFTATILNEGTLAYTKTQEMRDKGYRYVTVTFENATSTIWVGNGKWGETEKYQHAVSADNNWTITIDLNDGNMSGNNFVIQFAGDENVKVTYQFTK